MDTRWRWKRDGRDMETSLWVGQRRFRAALLITRSSPMDILHLDVRLALGAGQEEMISGFSFIKP
jgi:hypothetical protein